MVYARSTHKREIDKAGSIVIPSFFFESVNSGFPEIWFAPAPVIAHIWSILHHPVNFRFGNHNNSTSQQLKFHSTLEFPFENSSCQFTSVFKPNDVDNFLFHVLYYLSEAIHRQQKKKENEYKSNKEFHVYTF